jgi:hypothetical protein
MSYSIDDAHGNQLTTGLSEHEVTKAARSWANKLDASVYYYEDGSDEEPIEVVPDRMFLVPQSSDE